MITGKVIIFDLDGTLALTGHRQHFLEGDVKDWEGFFQACDKDEPNEPIVQLYNTLYPDNRIIIFSGRSDAVFDKTSAWIEDNLVGYPDELRMRPEGLFIPDEDLKLNWLNELPKEWRDNLIFVVDDRDKVVQMWRDQGLTCLQVAEGNF